MTTTLPKGITSAYQAAQEVADAGLDEETARRLAGSIKRDGLVDIATEHIMGLARRVRRERTLRAERNAVRPATSAAERQIHATIGNRNPEADRTAGLAIGRYEHGSADIETGAALRGCNCPPCVTARDSDDGVAERDRLADMSALIARHASTLRIDWTRELLESSFGLDGSDVTWGQATAEMHRRRAEVFATQGIAAIEGAARHVAAAEALEAAGAKCLDELTGVAA